MSVRNTLYHATVKGMRKLSSARMDLPDVDMKTDLVRARVVSNQELAPQLRRLTLTAPEFASVTLTGADEYVGLLMPRQGKLTMPDPTIANIRRERDTRRQPTVFTLVHDPGVTSRHRRS